MKTIHRIEENRTKLELKIKEITGWHKARVYVIVALIMAIIQERSVNLKRLANYINSKLEHKAKYRRVTRFFQKFEFDRKMFIRLLTSFLPKDKRWILIMDRTNWKFGKIHINILVLSVKYKGIAIPILWYLLDKKRGNSSYRDRIRILRQFINIFGSEKIELLLADREFVGKEWFAWLKRREIPFVIRVKNNALVNGKKISTLFAKVPNKGFLHLKKSMQYMVLMD